MNTQHSNLLHLPFHPRTGLRAVGIVAGRPVWPIRGGSGEGDAPSGGNDPSGAAGGDAGDQSAGKQPDTTPPQPSGQPANGSGSGGQGGSGDGDKKFTQADLDKKIAERLKREEKKGVDADAKVTAAQQEAADAKAAHDKLMAGLADALGLKKDDAPPDPAALQQTLAQRENRVSELEQQIASRDVELAAWKSAVENGANPLHLMDRRSFLDELGKLDRKSDKFGEHLDAAVKAALERDESLKAAGTPRTPRPDPSQGSGRPAPAGAERGTAEAQRRFGNQQQAAGKPI